MRKFLKVVCLSIFCLGLVAVIYSTPKSVIQATAPNCPTTNPTNIRLQDSFLMLVDVASNAFFSAVTPTTVPQRCIIGENAAIPQFSISSYNDMKSLYFDQSKIPSGQKTSLDGNRTANDIVLSNTAERIYKIGGNLTLGIGGDIVTSSDIKTGVIFVDGNLLIQSSQGILNSPTSGLVFVVGGKVWIDGEVPQVNAVIIAYDSFCSSSTGDFTSGLNCSLGTIPLTINGSLILKNKPNFARILSNNANPAETITFQPKYLVILRDLFSKDLQVWNEIQ